MISLEIFLNHLKRNPTDNCFEALGIMPFKQKTRNHLSAKNK
jgi:hypothetical protein